MRLVIVNPALIFVGLQMEGYEAKHSLSPLLSQLCVVEVMEAMRVPERVRDPKYCYVMRRTKSLKESFIWDILQLYNDATELCFPKVGA